ncbi:MAG: hypothetical protein EOO68_05170, partial [Moraxellaceae bacterium]
MRTEPSISADSADLQKDHQFPPESYDSQLLADYRQRYGLSVDPFVDDPHFPFYTGAQRRQILDQLLHLCQFSNNLLLVLGAYGVGKTRTAQALIDSLADEDDICFLEGQVNSSLDSLLAEVLEQFELEDTENLSEFLKRNSDQDGLAVFMIDNAHHLADSTLKEVIALIHSGEETRAHLVLFGEAHLLKRLQKLDLPEVIVSDFFLEKFSLTETVDYLNFRMEMADYLGPEIFTETKVDPWWRQSQGQLMVLHELAQERLLASVSPAQHSTSSGLPVPHIIGASVLGAALIFGFMYWGGSSSSTGSGNNSAESSLAQLPQSSVPIEPVSSSVVPQIATANSVSQTPAADIVQSTAAEIHPISTENESSLASVIPPPVVQENYSASSAVVTEPQPSSLVVQSVVPLAQTNVLPEGSARSVARSSNVSSIKKQVSQQLSTKSIDKLPAASKLPSATRNYSDQEKQILSWGESEFTLQLVGLSSEK